MRIKDKETGISIKCDDLVYESGRIRARFHGMIVAILASSRAEIIFNEREIPTEDLQIGR